MAQLQAEVKYLSLQIKKLTNIIEKNNIQAPSETKEENKMPPSKTYAMIAQTKETPKDSKDTNTKIKTAAVGSTEPRFQRHESSATSTKPTQTKGKEEEDKEGSVPRGSDNTVKNTQKKLQNKENNPTDISKIKKINFQYKSPEDKYIPINQRTQSLPKIEALHDSTLNKIDFKRLGKSYDFEIQSCRSSTIKEASEQLFYIKEEKEIDPDAILIHCGINDIKTASTAETIEKAKDLEGTIIQAKELFPYTKILVSEIAPVRGYNLERKRRIFNRYLQDHTKDKKDIRILTMESLNPTRRAMKDSIHVTDKGANIMAGIMGRQLRRSLWEKIPSKNYHRERRSTQHYLDRHYQPSKDYQTRSFRTLRQNNIWSSRDYYLNHY